MRNFLPVDLFYAKRYLELMAQVEDNSTTQAFLASDIGTDDNIICELPLKVIQLMATRENLPANPSQAFSNIQVCRRYVKTASELALHDTPLVPATNKMVNVLQRGYQ